MPGAVFLTGGDVTLRTIEQEDLEFLRDTINAPQVRQYLGNRGPLNLEQEQSYFEDHVSDDASTSLLVCVDGNPAGIVGLHPRDDTSGTAEIGLFLAEDYWGHGYGTTTVALVTEYGFNDRRHHRIEGHVIEPNSASQRVFEKAGYQLDATHREAAYYDGNHVDVNIYAAFAPEWDPDPGLFE